MESMLNEAGPLGSNRWESVAMSHLSLPFDMSYAGETDRQTAIQLTDTDM